MFPLSDVSRFPFSWSPTSTLIKSTPPKERREKLVVAKRESPKEKKRCIFAGIRASFARRERCIRVPLLFVDVVGTDVPTNADRMEREENMFLFVRVLFVCDE